MIASFLAKEMIGTQLFELVLSDRGTHLQPLYHLTTLQLHTHAAIVQTVVMPYRHSDIEVAFDYDDLIAHIIWDETFDLSQITFHVVYPEGTSLNERDLALVENGIQFVSESEVESRVLSAERKVVSIDAVKHTLNGKLTQRDRGHDQANRWGAFCLLYAIYLITGDANTDLETVTDRLSEDLYYKERIAKLRSSIAGEELAEKLCRVRRNWVELISTQAEPITALIVEDELSEGWNSAYTAVLGPTKISFARNIQEFRETVVDQFDFVLLDLRLKGDMHTSISSVFAESVKKLPGITIAHELRSKGIMVPIVACTASDKAVTLDVLQQHEVNQLWTKPNPAIVCSADDILKSVGDFIEKILHCVSWSLETRALVEGIERIQKSVINPPPVHNEIVRKSKAFRALFFEKFSDACNVISNGLQFDLGYLIAHSLINELIFWKCRYVKISRTSVGLEFSKPSGDRVQIFHIELASKSNGFKRRYLIEEEFRIALNLKPAYGGDLSIQEAQVFRCLLHDLELIDAEDQFKGLVGVRNSLSLVHGKVGDREHSIHRTATAVDIAKLLGIYQQFVTKLT